MRKSLMGIAVSLLAFNVAFAQAPTKSVPADTKAASAPVASSGGSCADRAIGKNGKSLAGAAKTSFMKKCEADSKGGPVADSGCAAKAMSKNGKPLAGEAKTSFMKKCEADAKGGK